MTDLIKRLRHGADGMGFCCPECLEAADEIERLTAILTLFRADIADLVAVNNELRADAERYRWLRERSCWTISVDASLLKLAISAPGLAEPLSRSDDELDAAIDAARKDKP